MRRHRGLTRILRAFAIVWSSGIRWLMCWVRLLLLLQNWRLMAARICPPAKKLLFGSSFLLHLLLGAFSLILDTHHGLDVFIALPRGLPREEAVATRFAFRISFVFFAASG